jgi:hypothetical protein
MYVFIKYLRYNALIGRKFATWVSISEDRDVLHLLAQFHRFKIFYKSNIKWSLVSILWYKHFGSCRALEQSEKHSALKTGFFSQSELVLHCYNINYAWPLKNNKILPSMFSVKTWMRATLNTIIWKPWIKYQ